MKAEIHPDYVEAHVRCTCGNEFTTRSTQAEIHVEICSNCHPFYTGKQKLVDTGGRVWDFRRRQARGAAPSHQTRRGQRNFAHLPIVEAGVLLVLAIVAALAACPAASL